MRYRGAAKGHGVYGFHPLVKLGWLVAVSAGVFVLAHPLHMLVLLGALVGLMAWAGVRPRRDLRGSGVLLWMTLLLFGLQVVFWDEGQVVAHLLPWARRWPVTDGGLRRGIIVGGRFAVIVLSSQLFVLLTDPGALAYALMQAGLPYRYGFALVTALRLVPVFEVEATTVYQAQLVRGVRYDAHALRRIYELVRQFMFPMLVSALHKVDALAISMEGRQFGLYPKRTYLRQSDLGRADWIAILALSLYIAVTIYLRLVI